MNMLTHKIKKFNSISFSIEKNNPIIYIDINGSEYRFNNRDIEYLQLSK